MLTIRIFKKPPTIIFLVFFLFLSLFKPKTALAQNKAGINIGDHHNDFDHAAEIVGPGGWVVVMACPGDADKIAKMIQDHPEINLVIRGHYPPGQPDANLAKLWAASLATIPSPNKIYFMPWNEPNQEGSDDYGTPSGLNSYINILKNELGPLRSRIVLLSPMMNITHPNFETYKNSLLQINSNFFNQFEGIAFSLYDTCGGCSNPYGNPLFSPQLLVGMAAIGKKIFGVEAGTMGANRYFSQPPSSNSPLYGVVDRLLSQSSSEIKMFAIPAYDLGGEVGHSWSLFDPPDVINLLRSAPDGATTPGSGPIVSNLNQCPGKKYSFYSINEAECSECGSTVSVCKPIKETDQFGEEASREPVSLPLKLSYTNINPECLNAQFSGNLEISGVEIPFARNLNYYFLGPYADNLKARTVKEKLDPLKDYGVLEKIVPLEIQDNLKLGFLAEISQRGSQSRYLNFRIEGKAAPEITETFKRIQEKKGKERLTAEETNFLLKIWTQIPLFANEEAEGEIAIYGTGVTGDNFVNKVKTSVPEVYRLYRATEFLNQMLNPQNQPAGWTQTRFQVLPAGTCLETSVVSPVYNNKEGKTGYADNVCTKDEIQPNPNGSIFSGERTMINDTAGSCEKPGEAVCQTDQDLGRCCSINEVPGKCVQGLAGQAAICSTACGTGCWKDPNSNPLHLYPNCCIPPFKTKDLNDVKLITVNKIPYLNLIADNTVNETGIFKIFIPPPDQNTPEEIYHVFREVVGESAAELKISNLQVKNSNYYSFEVNQGQNLASPIALLFHKLGTIINVKDFVAGKLLWPYRPFSEFTDTEPGKLTYTLDFKNSLFSICPETKNKVIQSVKSSWPNSQIETSWDLVYNQAVTHGWNPAFVLTLWIEESGASGVPAYDLGCLAGERNNLQSQLDCLFRNYDSETNFEKFMCLYSEGHYPCETYVTNPNFPKNIKYWFDRLTEPC